MQRLLPKMSFLAKEKVAYLGNMIETLHAVQNLKLETILYTQQLQIGFKFSVLHLAKFLHTQQLYIKQKNQIIFNKEDKQKINNLQSNCMINTSSTWNKWRSKLS